MDYEKKALEILDKLREIRDLGDVEAQDHAKEIIEVAKEVLSDKDLRTSLYKSPRSGSFVESVVNQYTHKGSITPAQARGLKNVLGKSYPINLSMDIVRRNPMVQELMQLSRGEHIPDSELIKITDEILHDDNLRKPLGKRSAGFLESVLNQVTRTGEKYTPAQMTGIRNTLTRYAVMLPKYLAKKLREGQG
jgi:hypothetical protein